jgi:hypothetical protein
VDAQQLSALPLEIFKSTSWQMSLGERAALEGVLSQARPSLSIELGTAQGGSLQRIAHYSDEAHTFDLIAPEFDADRFPNVTFHIGDSHELLPEVLEKLAEEGRNVDFVLVDGDHASEGVRRDLEHLLESPAVGSTIIVLHDTLNEWVRNGVTAVPITSYPKVVHYELDFVPGYLLREEPHSELWGGLGLIVIDSTRLRYGTPSASPDRYWDVSPWLRRARDEIASREQAGAVQSNS